jgi:hypothetical protein
MEKNELLKIKVRDGNQAIMSAFKVLDNGTLDFHYQLSKTSSWAREPIIEKYEYTIGMDIQRIPFDYNEIKFNMIPCPKSEELSLFMIGETQVTQELFQAVMGGFNPSYFNPLSRDESDDENNNYSYQRWQSKPDETLGQDYLKRPVERVYFYDCLEFCNKLSVAMGYKPYYTMYDKKGNEWTRINRQTGKTNWHPKYPKFTVDSDAIGFRLPTQLEWLYAFYAWNTDKEYNRTNRKFRLGESLKRSAWLAVNSDDHTHPVAQKLPNEWGIYDMIGNVSEFLEDFDPGDSRQTIGHHCQTGNVDRLYLEDKGDGLSSTSGFRIVLNSDIHDLDKRNEAFKIFKESQEDE